ncbi:MAG: DUF2341 domain-containing protein, partial [Candidatus Omnitrophota bacterium]
MKTKKARGKKRMSREGRIALLVAVALTTGVFLSFAIKSLSSSETPQLNEGVSYKSALVWRTDDKGDYTLSAMAAGNTYEVTNAVETQGEINSITASYKFKGQVRVEVSADNGASFTGIVNGVPLTTGFTRGNMLKWRLTLGDDSELTEMKIKYTDASGVAGSFGNPQLSGFGVRKAISVTNSSNDELFNYQLPVKVGESSGASGYDVHCEGKIQADFQDVRFTCADGETVLPHYLEKIEGAYPGRVATFWVKVPQIPQAGVALFIYYGNSAAEDLSDPEETFDFYDNFDEEELDSGKWEVTASAEGACTLENSLLTLDAAKVVSKDYQIKDGVIEYRAKAEAGYEIRAIVRDDKVSSENTQLVHASNYSGAEHSIAVGNIVKTNTSSAISPQVFYEFRVAAEGAKLTFERYNQDYSVQQATATITDTGGLTEGCLGLQVGGSGNGEIVANYDWIRARKLSIPEPSLSTSGVEEEVNLAQFSKTAIAENGDLVLSSDAGTYSASGTYMPPAQTSTCNISAISPQWKATVPSGTYLSVDISANAGANWKLAALSGETYTAPGDFTAEKSLKVRANLSSASLSLTPAITELRIDYSAGPIVTSDNISPLGATGQGGTYQAGDTIIVEWDNSAEGDNNPDILSASCNFEAFGGAAESEMSDDGPQGARGDRVAGDNIYTAQYALPAGIDTTANMYVSATNLCGITTRDGHILDVDTTGAAVAVTPEAEEEVAAVPTEEEVVTEEAAPVEEEEEVEEEVTPEARAGGGFSVSVYNAQTNPEDFYLVDEEENFVPYIFKEVSPNRYEVSLKSLKGAQKYVFTRKGIALWEDEGEGEKEKVQQSWFNLEGKGRRDSQWQKIPARDGVLSYEENDDGTITIYNTSALGTLTAKLGFDGREYYNKFSFKTHTSTLGYREGRVLWDTTFKKRNAVRRSNLDIKHRVKRKVKRLGLEREEEVVERVSRDKIDNVVVDWKDFVDSEDKRQRRERRAVARKDRAQRFTATHPDNPHNAPLCRVAFYEEGKTGEMDIDPVLSATQASSTITVETDGLSTSDFKLVFNQDDGGISDFRLGDTSDWSDNYGSATELLTELDQDAAVQVDAQSTLRLLEANATRIKVENRFALGTEADPVIEHWTIYPTGKIVKRIIYDKDEIGTEARRVDDGAVDYVASGMSGYHPSTPSVDRGIATHYDTQMIEIIGSDTGQIDDYQTPGAPTVTSGTLLTNVLGDADSDGFNEGDGAYEILASSKSATFSLDGSTQTKYKPVFKIHEVYPRTTGATTERITVHYRLDETSGTALDNTQGTASRDAVASANVSGMTSTTAQRGTAINIDADGENFYGISANIRSDWSETTIEFWYQPNYTFASDHTGAAKYLFGSAAAGTANAIWARVYEGATDATLEFGIKGATNESKTTITETQDTLWNAGDWVHLRFVWDDSTTSTNVCSIYYNGNYVTQTHTNTDSAMSTIGTNLYFGDYRASGTDNAEGVFDEIYIYTCAIVPYGAFQSDFSESFSNPHPDLTFYDAMDSTTADADYSDGTATRTQSGTSTATGAYGNGILFNASGDYQSFVSASNIVNTAGSLGMWIKSSSATNPTGTEYLFYGDANFNLSYDTSGYLNFKVAAATTLQDATDTYDGRYHWIKVTWDYTNDRYAIYIDGQSEATDTTALTAPTLDTNFYIGNSEALDVSFSGIIDELYITSGASTAEIYTLFGQPIIELQVNIDNSEKVVGTNYNYSHTNCISSYVVQYLTNFTTNTTVDVGRGSVPTVTNVTSTNDNGTYNLGDTIDVTVEFTELVNVTGTPQLTLDTGGAGSAANYTSGTGTTTLTFQYTVSVGDSSSDLAYIETNPLALNGGTIRDATLNDASLTLPTAGGSGSLSNNKEIVIDSTFPASATNVTSGKFNETYDVGEIIDITVTFGSAANFGGTPQLELETRASGTDTAATYVSGEGTTTITLRYIVKLGDDSDDLDYTSANALTLNGETIATLPAPAAAGSLGNNKALVIDTDYATTTTVSKSVGNKTALGGTGTVAIDADGDTLTFSGVSLSADIGKGDKIVIDADGDNDADNDDPAYYIASKTSSTVVTLQSQSTTTSSLYNQSGKKFSLDEAYTSLQAWSTGEEGDLVTADKIVEAVCYPMEDTTAATISRATYITNSTHYVNVYAHPDYTHPGKWVASSQCYTLKDATLWLPKVFARFTGILLHQTGFNAAVHMQNGGYSDVVTTYFDRCIMRGPGRTAWATGGVCFKGTDHGVGPGAGGHGSNIIVRNCVIYDGGSALGTTGLARLANNWNYYVYNTVVDGIVIAYNDGYDGNAHYTMRNSIASDVAYFGNSDAGVDYCIYADPRGDETTVPGDNSIFLADSVCEYTDLFVDPANGDHHLKSTETWAKNSGEDVSGETYGFTEDIDQDDRTGLDWDIGADQVISVANVSATEADGSYVLNDTLHITVEFSGAVTVSGGTPQLELETGDPDRQASYTTGTGTDTLTFEYTVQAGDGSDDLDYTGTDALTLNGATIVDAHGYNVDLILQTPGDPGSLSANKQIVIDNVAPTVDSVVLDPTNPTGDTALITFTITFDEDMDTSLAPTVTCGTAAPYNAITINPKTGEGYINGYTDPADIKVWEGTTTQATTVGTYNISISAARDLGENVMTTDTSNQFSVAAGAADKVVVLDPTDGTVDADISVTIQIQDQSDNLVTTASESVTITTDGDCIINGVTTGTGTSAPYDSNSESVTSDSGVIVVTLHDETMETVNINVDHATLTDTSTQDVIFDNGSATQVVVVNPTDGTV